MDQVQQTVGVSSIQRMVVGQASSTTMIAEKSRREKTLDAAKGCVLKDRNSVYGGPEENFTKTAEILNAVLESKLKEKLTPTDVAMIQICLKMARLVKTPSHQDTWVDIAGYAACGSECAEKTANG